MELAHSVELDINLVMSNMAEAPNRSIPVALLKPTPNLKPKKKVVVAVVRPVLQTDGGGTATIGQQHIASHSPKSERKLRKMTVKVNRVEEARRKLSLQKVGGHCLIESIYVRSRVPGFFTSQTSQESRQDPGIINRLKHSNRSQVRESKESSFSRKTVESGKNEVHEVSKQTTLVSSAPVTLTNQAENIVMPSNTENFEHEKVNSVPQDVSKGMTNSQYNESIPQAQAPDVTLFNIQQVTLPSNTRISSALKSSANILGIRKNRETGKFKKLRFSEDVKSDGNGLVETTTAD